MSSRIVRCPVRTVRRYRPKTSRLTNAQRGIVRPTPSINASAHRAQEESRAAQPVSEANALLTPTSTVAACCVDGVDLAQAKPLNRERPP